MSERVEVIGARPDAEGREAPHIVRLRGSLWQRMTSNSLLRHNLLLFGATMAANAFNFLFHPIIGHLLRDTQYGKVVSFTAFTQILALPAIVIPSIFNKFTADLTAQGHIEQANYLLRRATFFLILAGVLAAVIFAAFSPVFVGIFKVPPQYSLITSLTFVLAFAAPLMLGAIQGRQQFAWFSLLNFLSAFLRVAFTAVLLVIGFGLNGTLIATLLTAFFMYICSFLPLRDIFRAPLSRLPSLKPLFKYSLSATLAVGASTLLSNTDTALATPFLTPRDASYYDAIATMGRIVLVVSGSLLLVMFPKVAALHQQGLPHRGVLALTMVGVGVLSSSVVIFFALFPRQVVTVIFQSPVPLAAARPLIWYGVAMFFLEVASVLMSYFMALGRMTFVPILFACWVLQLVLFMVWHGSIAQMATVMVVVMATLLAGMVGFYFLHVKRLSHGIGLKSPGVPV